MNNKEFREFAQATSEAMEALKAENRQLRQKFQTAEELLAKLTIASDQAKSLHDSMMVERQHSAEQRHQARKLQEEQDQAYQARHDNAMNSLKMQVQRVYDNNARVEEMLSEVNQGRKEFIEQKESLSRHHEWIINNMNSKSEELSKFAARDYVDQELQKREEEGLTRLQQEHLDRNLRLIVSDPNAYLQSLQSE